MKSLSDYNARLIDEVITAILHPQNEADGLLASIYFYFLKRYQGRLLVTRPPDELFQPYVASIGNRADAKVRAELSAHLAYQVAGGTDLEAIKQSLIPTTPPDEPAILDQPATSSTLVVNAAFPAASLVPTTGRTTPSDTLPQYENPVPNHIGVERNANAQSRSATPYDAVVAVTEPAIPIPTTGDTFSGPPATPPSCDNPAPIVPTPATSVTAPAVPAPGQGTYPLWSWGYFAKSLSTSVLLGVVLDVLLHPDPTTGGMMIAAMLLVATVIRVWTWAAHEGLDIWKRIVVIVAVCLVVTYACGVLGGLAVYIFNGIASSSSNNTSTQWATSVPTAQPYRQPTVYVNLQATAENTYIEQVNRIAQAAANDLKGINYLWDQVSTRINGTRNTVWKSQMDKALEKLNNDMNHVYPISPPERFATIHQHLLNTTYHLQRYIYLLEAGLPACAWCAGDAQAINQAMDHRQLALLELAQFNNELHGAVYP